MFLEDPHTDSSPSEALTLGSGVIAVTQKSLETYKERVSFVTFWWVLKEKLLFLLCKIPQARTIFPVLSPPLQGQIWIFIDLVNSILVTPWDPIEHNLHNNEGNFFG